MGKNDKKFRKHNKEVLAGHLTAIQTMTNTIFRTVVTIAIGDKLNKLMDENPDDVVVDAKIVIHKIAEYISEEKEGKAADCFAALTACVYSNGVEKGVQVDNEAVGRLTQEIRKIVTYDLVKKINDTYDAKQEGLSALLQGTVEKYQGQLNEELDVVSSGGAIEEISEAEIVEKTEEVR